MAIGFILLVPSILGMIASALIFFGVVTYNWTGAGETTAQSIHQDFDTSFRSSCINQTTAPGTSISTLEQYCECALKAYKATNSEQAAGSECSTELQAGALQPLSEQAQEAYDALITNTAIPVAADRQPQSDALHGLFNLIGSGFAIVLGIASFVSGLLGWLLVMKKLVLQCSVCGATVNAS
ncbi:MAG: hypothetical protein ACYDCD_01095 [Candidatus Acidiferrales bacterium]